MSKSKKKTLSLPPEDPQLTRKASSHKTVVNIKGKVSAQRDVVMGDQYNDFRQQVVKIASSQEFIAKLQELQDNLTQVKQQSTLLPEQKETLEIIKGNIQTVIDEAKKSQPYLARIKAHLGAAESLMSSLSENAASAVGLGTTIASFRHIALKLFED